jgi:hypothetical protein
MGSGKGRSRRAQFRSAFNPETPLVFETDIKMLYPYFAENELELKQMTEPLIYRTTLDGATVKHLICVFLHSERDVISLVDIEETPPGDAGYRIQFIRDEKTAQRRIRQLRSKLLSDGYIAVTESTNIPIGSMRDGRAYLRERYLTPLRLPENKVGAVTF